MQHVVGMQHVMTVSVQHVVYNVHAISCIVAYVKLRQAGMLPGKACLTHACYDAAHWFQ